MIKKTRDVECFVKDSSRLMYIHFVLSLLDKLSKGKVS